MKGRGLHKDVSIRRHVSSEQDGLSLLGSCVDLPGRRMRTSLEGSQ